MNTKEFVEEKVNNFKKFCAESIKEHPNLQDKMNQLSSFMFSGSPLTNLELTCIPVKLSFSPISFLNIFTLIVTFTHLVTNSTQYEFNY